MIIALPRWKKDRVLADGCWLPGACVSSPPAPMYDLTAGTGLVEVFNPYRVGGLPSTRTRTSSPGARLWRSAARSASETAKEMVFWSDKAAVALAGLMHAAAVGGYDMSKVYLWANRSGESELAALARDPGASRELFAGLAEIFADTKAASSIRMTLLRSLGWLAVPELRDMVCGPEIRPVDAGEFAASGSTLYMILRDCSSSVAAPLFRRIGGT